MSSPAMWWGSCPDHPQLHAVAPCDITAASERGWTEALRGRQLPADVALFSGPSGELCLPCVLGATADLTDATEQLVFPPPPIVEEESREASKEQGE